MGRRTPRFAAVAALALSLAAAAGGVLGGPAIAQRVEGTATTWRPGSPPGSPQAVLDGTSGSAPVPATAGLSAVLAPLLAAPVLGGRGSISIVDVTTGRTVFAQNPDIAIVPASTTKLVTGATVLAARGPTYRIATKVVAGASPGEVVLVGGGDPTLTAGAGGTYPGAARLDELARATKDALGGVAPTRVVYDVSLYSGDAPFGPGWDADVPTGGYGGPITALMLDGARTNPRQRSGQGARLAQPDLFAAQTFARLLGVPGGAVAGTAPSGAKELAKVESAPMLRLVEIMMTESDNIIAEALAKQVALATGQPGTFAAASAAMRAVLTDLDIPIEGYGLADGSGLSRFNKLTPALLTALLARTAKPGEPDLRGVLTGLPVGGYSGTLAARYRSPATGGSGAGTVRGKTGTLTGVASLAGVLVDADGRMLAFAAMTDAVPAGGGTNAQQQLDRVAAAIATCGCR